MMDLRTFVEIVGEPALLPYQRKLLDDMEKLSRCKAQDRHAWRCKSLYRRYARKVVCQAQMDFSKSSAMSSTAVVSKVPGLPPSS